MKRIVLLMLFAALFFYGCQQKQTAYSGGDVLFTHIKVDLSSMGPAFLLKLNEQLYNDAISGKTRVYRYDSLTATSLIAVEEVSKVGTFEELVEIVEDPEYPDYTYDSLIVNPFMLKDIKGYEISQVWSVEKGTDNYVSRINAIAFRYKPYVAGIYLNEQALFWFSFDDFKKYLSKDDLEIFMKLVLEENVSALTEY